MMQTENASISQKEGFGQLRVALVHYWLLYRRGGERVLEALAEIFPQADLYAVLADRKSLTPALGCLSLRTSFLQHIPGNRRFYRQLLALHPLALEQFDLRGYDLVISSESGPAKGVLTSPDTCHVCYCHSPMRYIWDSYHEYRNRLGRLTKPIFTLAAHYMRLWDLVSASRVDYFAANSMYTAQRIRKYYRRESTVIYPPVEVSAGYISPDVDDYYLFVGRLVDYKRVDLAIEGCNRLRRALHIVGDGIQYKQLRRLAGPTVKFLGPLGDGELREQLARCRALLFPGQEDFGIVPIEAQSFGRPIIAYGRGGALETVRGFSHGQSADPEECTGVFFSEQTADSLVRAICLFESIESRFLPTFIQAHVRRFGVSRFKTEMASFISNQLNEYRYPEGTRGPESKHPPQPREQSVFQIQPTPLAIHAEDAFERS